MKILHIDTEKEWRGGQNQLLNILKVSTSAAVENIVVLHSKAKFIDKMRPFAQIELVSMSNDLDFFAALRIARICRKNKIELIHTHTARAHALGIYAKQILRLMYHQHVKLLVHKRVEVSANMGFLTRQKTLHPSIDHFITVSQIIKSSLEKIGVNSGKVTCIYSGVEMPSAETLALTDMTTYKRGAKVIIASAAHLSPKKGLNVLVDALKYLKGHKDWHCYIAGQGESRSELEEQVTKLGLSERVTVLGFLPKLDELLHVTDIFVLPTLWEGLGTVLLEAALFECALIGSDVGGVPEVILQGKTGLLAKPGDAMSLATQIEQLLSDVVIRQNLAKNAKEFVTNNFSSQLSTSRILELYKKILYD